MRGFPGFPNGKLKVTPLPNLFFSDLLPLIDDLFELKVTLHGLWLLQQKKGEPRYFTFTELAQDETLMRSLQGSSLKPLEVLRESLERAVARGTLLQATAQRGETNEQLYLLNSESGRAAIHRIESGEWQPEEWDEPVRLRANRPNIFVLYEQNIGLLQPILAEELMDAERTYPPEWIMDAFRIAVAQNVRRWAYVRGILERWAQDGRRTSQTDESKAGRKRYLGGEYADLIEH